MTAIAKMAATAGDMYEDCLCSVPFPFRLSYIVHQLEAISRCADSLTQERSTGKTRAELVARVMCITMDVVDLASNFLIVYLPTLAPLQETSPLFPLIATISLVVAEILRNQRLGGVRLNTTSSFTIFTLGFRLENVLKVESSISASMLGAISNFVAKKVYLLFIRKSGSGEKIKEAPPHVGQRNEEKEVPENARRGSEGADHRTSTSNFSTIVKYTLNPTLLDLVENVGGSVFFAKLAYMRCSDTLKWKMVSVLNASAALYGIHLCRMIAFYAMAPLSKKIPYMGKGVSNFFKWLRPAYCDYWQVWSNSLYLQPRRGVMDYNNKNPQSQLSIPPRRIIGEYIPLPDTYKEDSVFSRYVCAITQKNIRYPIVVKKEGNISQYYELSELCTWVMNHGTEPYTQNKIELDKYEIDLEALKAIENRMGELGLPVAIP